MCSADTAMEKTQPKTLAYIRFAAHYSRKVMYTRGVFCMLVVVRTAALINPVSEMTDG